jgi:hypothetical protein
MPAASEVERDLVPSPTDTMPLVNTPVRSSLGSRFSMSTRMLVSSLCNLVLYLGYTIAAKYQATFRA